MTYAIVRQDASPQEWWDGYYAGPVLSGSMAEYWSRELGVRCYAMKASWPDLPADGYQAAAEEKISCQS
jgi:hypothetical protein